MKKELEMLFGGRGGSTYFDDTKMQNHIDLMILYPYVLFMIS